MTASSQEAKGFFDEVKESVRSHVEERIKSPFAGAFVIAWLAVNWPAVTFLVVSERPIIERISVVGKLLGAWNALFCPILLAFALAVVFYACSSVFILLAEAYGVAKRHVEQQFDKLTWVKPVEYIKLKQEYEDENARLMSLASGNLALVDAEKSKAVEAAKKTLEAQEELAQRSLKLEAAVSELSAAKEELAALRGMRNDMLGRIQQSSIANSRRDEASEKLKLLGIRLRLLLGSTPDSKLSRDVLKSVFDGLAELRDLIDNPVHDTSEPRAVYPDVTDDAVTIDSVAQLLARRYPEAKLDVQHVSRILADVSASGLARRLRSVSDVEKVLLASGFAMEMYRAEKPEMFTKASDFLSKALGFAYPEFLKYHRFATATQDAVAKFSNLVDYELLP